MTNYSVVPLGWEHIPILLWKYFSGALGQPAEFVFVAYYPKLLALYIGIAILFLAWIVASPNRVLIRTSSLTSIATLYIGLTALSIFWASNRVEATLLIVHHIGLLLLFFVLLHTVRVQNLTHHIRTIVAVGVIIATLGIIQYAGWGLYWLPSAGFPSSTLGYRNFAAMYALLCIPLSLLLFLETRREISLWGWALSTAVLITFLFCTRTRGAWVGLGVSALVGLIALFFLKTHDTHRLWRNIQSTLTREHTIPAIASLLLCIGFLSIVSPNMQGRGFDRNRSDKAQILTSATSILDRSKDQRRSVQDRLFMWQHTQEMIEDHPITGVGAGNWQIAYPAYDGGDIVWESATPRRPHNDYLWIAAEIGIPGLLIYLAFLITIAIYTIRLIATQNRSRVRLPLAFGMSILALSVHAFFSFPRERIAVSMGIAYQGLQQYNASTQALQRAFDLEPSNANIRSYLAKAHYSLGEHRLSKADTSGAISSYTAFLNIWQGDATSATTVNQKLQALQSPRP